MILSKTHPLIKQYRKIQGQKKFRDLEGLFGLEGMRLICDAASAGATLQCVMVTSEFMQKHARAVEEIQPMIERLELISDDLAQYISEVKTPQGIFALTKKLDKPFDAATIKKGKNYLLLCSVRDPGNVGTMLRTADAMGFGGAILHHCCDLYNSKTVRSSMGSLFHIDLYLCKDLPALLHQLRREQISTFACVVEPDAVPLSETSKKGVLVIGNEANGLPEEVVRLCSCSATIPMRGRAESLNAAAAAAICMYEFQRSV